MKKENEVKQEEDYECYQPYFYHHPDLGHPEQHTQYWNYTLQTFPAYPPVAPLIPHCHYFYLPNHPEADSRQPILPEQATHHDIQVQSPAVKVEKRKERESAERVERDQVMVERWGQKFGRNILSNIFHMAIKKIGSRDFSELTGKVIAINRMTIKQTDFRGRLEDKCKQTNGYVNVRSIRRLVIGNPIGATRQDIEFRKLLRILIRNYLQYHHIPHIYHSGKIKRDSRLLHLQAVRKLSLKLGRG